MNNDNPSVDHSSPLHGGSESNTILSISEDFISKHRLKEDLEGWRKEYMEMEVIEELIEEIINKYNLE